MSEIKRVKCPWCEMETTPKESKDKSDYADIVVMRCSECDKVLGSYLEENRKTLEKVRTF